MTHNADTTQTPRTATHDEFGDPYIDLEEWRDEPLRHLYVHGGFAGTETRFSLYIPPAERYEGRFFQYITPVPDSENLTQGQVGEEDRISFAVESGGYFVETNGGGPAAGDPFSGIDPTIGAYRANAAAAEYSRVVARRVFGEHRPYGYAFGGSGGGFRTIGGAENTVGVWDGFVPYVIGSPMAIPNCFTARVHALRVLRGRFEGIVDALEPGGSGDPFAGLNEEEREALDEVTRLGFPPRSWHAHKTMGMHGLAVLYPGVRAIDPGYFDDFWTVPGYLGADPTPSLLRDRVVHPTSIASLLSEQDVHALGLDLGDRPGQAHGTADDAWLGSTNEAPIAARLATLPAVDPQAAELVVGSGDAAGSRVVVLRLIGDIAVFGPADERVLTSLREGDEVTLDNSGFLAIQTYHRHQVPGTEYAVWDQFRNEDGTPKHPQRPMLVGPLFAAGAAGTVQTGAFEGRMIVIECLLDREAYPWQADWYRARVVEHLGELADDRFRLWMVDNANHGDFHEQEYPGHTVSYLGVLHQALRDVAAWVERGVEPPESTDYRVVDGQVRVPAAAIDRRGVQPVLELAIDGADSVSVRTGEPVVITATATAPGTGRIVDIEWDLDGSGVYAGDSGTRVDERVVVERSATFDAPGVYFVAARAVAHRNGDAADRFARLQDVARVRVVVH